MTARCLATIVCGNAGVGKSTLAKRLGAQQGAAVIDIDTCTERLAQQVLIGHGLDPSDRDSPDYKRLLRDPIYETLFDIAVENLAHVPCIIVGPFTRERRDPTWPERLRQRLRSPVRILVVHCDPDERRRRIEKRANPRDAGKLSHWTAYAEQSTDRAIPPFEHEWIDTTLLL